VAPGDGLGRHGALVFGMHGGLLADSRVAQVDITGRPVVADDDIRQAGVAMDERFAGDICLEWAISGADRMKGAKRGGEHFDDGGRRPGFRQGR
jgi:hypothetical protein